MKRLILTLIILFVLTSVCLAPTAIMNSFSGGEFSPRVFGRTDVRDFYSGAREVENMFVKPHGPVEKRPGTYYIATAAGEGRIINFQRSAGTGHILEFTDQSIRFFK